ncbi:hypothetical protein MMC16_005940 [Acarospora aff. strigata]|nr:hypothetical protein [Acarospora aff. strigata]
MPVIDYSKLTGNPVERQAALQQLNESLQTYGFIYFGNHSIPQATVDEAFEWVGFQRLPKNAEPRRMLANPLQSKRFFGLPHGIKQSIAHPASGAVDDHRGFAEESLCLVSQLVFDRDEVQELRKTSPERKETLEIGNTYPNNDAPPNRWLREDQLPGFRAFVEQRWDECRRQV